jgi:predicted aldo/keto reductase-like oxidoreductase
MSISRREFMELAAISGLGVNAATGAEVDPKTGMPTRILGKTGARVSILAFGSGSRFLMYKEDKALEALNRALDLGITYIDTAYGYGNGESEKRVGQVLKARGGKKGLWLATKVNVRDADGAMKIIEGSLQRLQVSQVDLIHVHALGDENDLKAAEAKDGVINLLYKLRSQKVTRFMGVTCHADPLVLQHAIEHNDFDCTQMALNASRQGQTKLEAGRKDAFESTALVAAKKKNMGVTAMKIFAQEKLIGGAPVERLIRYSMSLPVAAAVIGMPKLEMIEENIRIAKAFKPLSRSEMDGMAQELAGKYKVAIDRHFADHIDC